MTRPAPMRPLSLRALTEGERALAREVFLDAFFTAFFTCGGLMPQRINDVRHGRLPLVRPDAFPRGVVLRILFPRCRTRRGAATRHDHAPCTTSPPLSSTVHVPTRKK